MRKINLSSIFIFLVFIACDNKSETNSNNSISKISTENNQFQQFPINNHNGNIYNIGNEFVYSYKFNFPSKKHSLNEGEKLDSITIKDLDEVKNIIIKVEKSEIKNSKGLAFRYNFPPQGISTSSTIIENDTMVWVHPPRKFIFKILELNPFPYILKPYKIGTKWSWELIIGEQFGDKRWKEWKSNITNYSNYENVGDTTLLTKLGNLNCHVTISSAKSKLGTTYLTSFFNEEYGFIKLDYTNIDGSKILLELIDYKVGIEYLKD